MSMCPLDLDGMEMNAMKRSKHHLMAQIDIIRCQPHEVCVPQPRVPPILMEMVEELRLG